MDSKDDPHTDRRGNSGSHVIAGSSAGPPKKRSMSDPSMQRLRERLVADLDAKTVVKPEPAVEEVLPPSADGWALKHASLLTIAMLFLVMLLPGGRTVSSLPPWELLVMPGSTNFIAGLIGLVAVSFQLRPLNPMQEAVVSSVIALVILIFGTLLIQGAVAGGAFDEQPTVNAFWRGSIAPSLLYFFGAVTLPAVLFWRHRSGQRLAPGVGIGIAVAMVAFLYLGGQVAGMSIGSPLSELLATVSESAYAGDRVAAILALVPGCIAGLSLLFLLPFPRLRRYASLCGLVFWVAAMLPLAILALYSAPATDWPLVLAPLKITMVLATGLMLLATALGGVLTHFEVAQARTS